MYSFFFNPFNGLSGNMIVGALLDAGYPFQMLQETLAKIPLNGFQMYHQKVERSGLVGTYFYVETLDATAVLTVEAILQIIKQTQLSTYNMELCNSIIYRLAEVQIKTRLNTEDQSVLEVTIPLDSFIYILGCIHGFEYFQVFTFYSTSINVGGGRLRFDQKIGQPLPKATTLELLKGYPIITGNVDIELATTTGAAILATCVPVSHINDVPTLIPNVIGYGAGRYELNNTPNFLRILIGKNQTREDSWFM